MNSAKYWAVCDNANTENNPSPDVPSTPARTFSVGTFVRKELLQRSSDMGSGISNSLPSRKLSKRNRKTIRSSAELNVFAPLNDNIYEEDIASAVPETPGRLQEGKRVLSKAFGSVRSKSMNMLRKPSNSSARLSRQVSFKSQTGSMVDESDTLSYNKPRPSNDRGSLDITDMKREYIKHAPVGVPTSLASAWMLFPEISIIPEIDYLDVCSEGSFWAAVLVTGALKRTGDCDKTPWSNDINPDALDHGYLCNVDIKVTGRSECLLEDVITDVNGPTTLRHGQTELVLAKVRMKSAMARTTHMRESSLELMNELESVLGNKFTTYLGVSVSYRHSAMPALCGSTAPRGMSYYASASKVEAHAILNRPTPESAWLTPAERRLNRSSWENSLFEIIDSHFDPVRATDIRRQICADARAREYVDTSLLSTPRNYSNLSVTSSSARTAVHERPESIVSTDPTLYTPSRTPRSSPSPATPRAMPVTSGEWLASGRRCVTLREHDPNSYDLGLQHLQPQQYDIERDDEDKENSSPDPARKIWNEMRKHSRGREGTPSSDPNSSPLQSGPFVSMLNLNLQAVDEYDDENQENIDPELEHEKKMIVQLAVRNKRSVGADTLRSLAVGKTNYGGGGSYRAGYGSVERRVMDRKEGGGGSGYSTASLAMPGGRRGFPGVGVGVGMGAGGMGVGGVGMQMPMPMQGGVHARKGWGWGGIWW